MSEKLVEEYWRILKQHQAGNHRGQLSNIIKQMLKEARMSKFFINVEWKENYMSNTLNEFPTVEKAKEWMIENWRKDNKIQLFEGKEIGWMYHEEIIIANKKAK